MTFFTLKTVTSYCYLPLPVPGIPVSAAQGKCVLIRILALQQQLEDEVTTAGVMYKVAEFRAAEWVIAQILDNGTSIGVCVCLRDLFFRQCRIVLEQQRAYPICPDQIDNLHVREYGICRQLDIAQKQGNEQGRHTNRQTADR